MEVRADASGAASVGRAHGFHRSGRARSGRADMSQLLASIRRPLSALIWVTVLIAGGYAYTVWSPLGIAADLARVWWVLVFVVLLAIAALSALVFLKDAKMWGNKSYSWGKVGFELGGWIATVSVCLSAAYAVAHLGGWL